MRLLSNHSIQMTKKVVNRKIEIRIRIHSEYKDIIALYTEGTLIKNAINFCYLGMYHFVEQYESAQGYLVNLVEDTIGEEPPADYVARCSLR